MKVGSIFTSQKKNQQAWFEKKKEELPRKFKNLRSTSQAMVMAFWDCYGTVYTEFGLDAHKEK